MFSMSAWELTRQLGADRLGAKDRGGGGRGEERNDRMPIKEKTVNPP